MAFESPTRANRVLELADLVAWEWRIGTDEIVLVGGGWPKSIAEPPPRTGRRFFEMVDPYDRRRLLRAVEDGKRGIVSSVRCRLTRSNAWIELRGFSGDQSVLTGLLYDVTGELQRDTHVLRRLRKLKLIIDNVPALIGYVDSDLNYRLGNATYRHWLDVDPQTMEGRSVREVIGEEGWSLIGDRLQRCLAGERISLETTFPFANGEHRTIRAEYVPDFDSTGVVRGAIILATDITEHVEAQARVQRLSVDLQSKVEELETLIDLLPAGVMIAKDPACALVEVNRRGAELIGVSEGRNVSLTSKGDDPLPFKVLRDGVEVRGADLPIQRAARLDQPVHDDLEILRDDGTTLTISLVASPLHDAQGQVRGALAVFIDVTQERAYQKELQDYKERLDAALSASSLGTFRWDTRTNQVRWDGYLHRLFGLDPGTSVDTLEDFLSYVHPEDRPRVTKALMACVDKGIDFEADFRILLTDGRVRWISDRGRAFLGADGRTSYITGACLDSTDRFEMAEALRQKIEALAEADRRKDEFLALLGHELRNPLAALVSGIQLLQEIGRHDEQTAGICASLARQAQHMTHLMDDLLDVSRISRGKVRLKTAPLDLQQAIRALIEDHAEAARSRGLHLDVTLCKEPLWINGDQTRIAQVLGNLLQNAIKFTAPGGTIKIVARAEGDRAVVEVQDDGVGMEQEHLTRIFEPFNQVSTTPGAPSQGLGLGLAIVKGLVNLHGGDVRALSDGPGKGATFVVAIPRIEPPIAQVLGEMVETSAAKGSFRILVVEDSPDVSLLFSLQLRNLGHEVRVAADGVEALETLQSYKPDLVFSDISMPRMNGYDLVKQVRAEERWNGIKVIAMTGYGQPEDRERALGAGFDRHLVKPVRMDALRQLLAEMAAR